MKAYYGITFERFCLILKIYLSLQKEEYYKSLEPEIIFHGFYYTVNDVKLRYYLVDILFLLSSSKLYMNYEVQIRKIKWRNSFIIM